MWDEVEEWETIGIWNAYENTNEVVFLTIDEMGVWGPIETKGLVDLENDGIQNGKVGDLYAVIWSSWTNFSNFSNWNQISWYFCNKLNPWLENLEMKDLNFVPSNTISKGLVSNWDLNKVFSNLISNCISFMDSIFLGKEHDLLKK